MGDGAIVWVMKGRGAGGSGRREVGRVGGWVRGEGDGRLNGWVRREEERNGSWEGWLGGARGECVCVEEKLYCREGRRKGVLEEGSCLGGGGSYTVGVGRWETVR